MLKKWIAYLLAVVLFESIADVYSKEWSIHGGWVRWLAGMGGYVIATAFWLMILKNGYTISKGVVLFSVSTLIAGLIIGLIIYKEPVNKLQAAGILIGIVSVILLLWE
jgi:drug/metabolite transporter (DMT)-like permease